MSKGILNNRDKMIWDNTHKPDISDVVAEIDDEMDDLLDDHDDKVVDIVGDNMNDLLDAHDDKVVSIVGDNMGALLSSNAAAIRLIGGDLSGITTTPAKVGKWLDGSDIYAVRCTGTTPENAGGFTIHTVTGHQVTPLYAYGWVKASNAWIIPVSAFVSGSGAMAGYYALATAALGLYIGATMVSQPYDVVIFYTATPIS